MKITRKELFKYIDNEIELNDYTRDSYIRFKCTLDKQIFTSYLYILCEKAAERHSKSDDQTFKDELFWKHLKNICYKINCQRRETIIDNLIEKNKWFFDEIEFEND